MQPEILEEGVKGQFSGGWIVSGNLGTACVSKRITKMKENVCHLVKFAVLAADLPAINGKIAATAPSDDELILDQLCKEKAKGVRSDPEEKCRKALLRVSYLLEMGTRVAQGPEERCSGGGVVEEEGEAGALRSDLELHFF